MSTRDNIPDNFPTSSLLNSKKQNNNNNNRKQQQQPGGADLTSVYHLTERVLKKDEVAINKNFLKIGSIIDIISIPIVAVYVFGWRRFGSAESLVPVNPGDIDWTWLLGFERWIVPIAFLSIVFMRLMTYILGKVDFNSR